MTTLSTIAEALEFAVERNTFHSKVIIGIATLFGVSGVILLSRAFSTQGPQRMVMLVGGGLLIVTILLLCERIQNLRKQNLVMEMVVAVISRIRDEATTDRISELAGQIAELAGRGDTGNGPLEEILEFVRRLDGRQVRSLKATSVGLLVAAGIAAVTVGASYFALKKGPADETVLSQEPGQVARDLERVSRPARQEKPETQPAKEQEFQTAVQTEALNSGGALAKQEASANREKPVVPQKQISALQQGLSVAQPQLKEERKKVDLLEDERGTSRRDAGELERRIEELEKTLAEHDYLRLVNEALAYTYRKEPGDADRAEAAYRKAIGIAQAQSIREPVVYNAYGAFLEEQGRFKEAEKFYKMALDINPRYGPALINLGSLYELTGEMEEALEKYKAAGEAGEKLGAENYSRLKSVIKR
ncbi:MAG: tetratricopeptide repeat protein [Candidatus Methylomirabilales bacterium]